MMASTSLIVSADTEAPKCVAVAQTLFETGPWQVRNGFDPEVEAERDAAVEALRFLIDDLEANGTAAGSLKRHRARVLAREGGLVSDWRDELGDAVKDLKALIVSADDQARAMTNAELGALLLIGRWTTIEVHEAGRRLLAEQEKEQP